MSQTMRDVEETTPSRTPSTSLKRPVHQAMHVGVFYALAGLFGAILLVFFFTFIGDPGTVFMIAVCAVYVIMFFGTPLVLSRISKPRGDSANWADFMDEPVATFNGPMSGRAALLQICIVPLALLVCVLAICVAIAIYR